MHIGEILNNVYDDDIGWRPASGAIKPVHVANGLVRAVQQAYFDTRELNQFVVWWSAGKVPDARRAFEALVSGEGAQRLGYLAHSQQDFERTRRYVLGLLGADKALFPSADLSSFSLTTGRMATRDNNDRGLGEFAEFLLSSEDGSDSLADEVLRSVEPNRPDDPVTILVWPLLHQEPKAAKHANKLGKASKRKHNREIFKAIREAANCLATHERAQGNRLHTLQRAVHFACVATHAHAQALAGHYVEVDNADHKLEFRTQSVRHHVRRESNDGRAQLELTYTDRLELPTVSIKLSFLPL